MINIFLLIVVLLGVGAEAIMSKKVYEIKKASTRETTECVPYDPEE